ncbi:hypothetical protein DSO57_1025033 [Entomophthora muscae]|uniref:Uncharacterized protein n=1 Tax=Entomophthora muscae TaxID=34485 RepID=A0ACC2UMA2_9FUNG|nr:hypothetical protein DSO57_1025033 [Entomophthora muscae]
MVLPILEVLQQSLGLLVLGLGLLHLSLRLLLLILVLMFLVWNPALYLKLLLLYLGLLLFILLLWPLKSTVSNLSRPIPESSWTPTGEAGWAWKAMYTIGAIWTR